MSNRPKITESQETPAPVDSLCFLCRSWLTPQGKLDWREVSLANDGGVLLQRFCCSHEVADCEESYVYFGGAW